MLKHARDGLDSNEARYLDVLDRLVDSKQVV